MKIKGTCFATLLKGLHEIKYVYFCVEVAGPLGTPLGLAQRKRASPRGEAWFLLVLKASFSLVDGSSTKDSEGSSLRFK